MIAKKFQNLIAQFTTSYPSFALINGDGQLLFSKDSRSEYLTTTRLVAFQIIKKYLKPKVNDLFILNDPENGGFNLTKIIFLASLHENLYLVWDADFNRIDFKIPPTPLYENGQKNAFVWSALIESQPDSEVMKAFFEKEKSCLDSLLKQKETLLFLSFAKNQTAWLKASTDIFDTQFASKALGSVEGSFKNAAHQLIKLKISIEERQNIKSFTLDFTNTTLATDYSAASHVVESGLIQRIIQYYQVENFFSQAILDKVKIILPPKSIVSKAHPRGEWNSEIQAICAQLCSHNLTQLNSQTRKNSSAFEVSPELKFEFIFNSNVYAMSLDCKNIQVEEIEKLVTQKMIRLIECNRTDQQIQIKFELADQFNPSLRLRSKLFSNGKEFSFKVNDTNEIPRLANLKAKDQIQIAWKIV